MGTSFFKVSVPSSSPDKIYSLVPARPTYIYEPGSGFEVDVL